MFSHLPIADGVDEQGEIEMSNRGAGRAGPPRACLRRVPGANGGAVLAGKFRKSLNLSDTTTSQLILCHFLFTIARKFLKTFSFPLGRQPAAPFERTSSIPKSVLSH
jgi:hypothetical protein